MIRLFLKTIMIVGMITPVLGLSNETNAELNCLTANIYAEARGESTKGMQAVGDVTVNRTKHSAFKRQDTICKVVLADGQFSWVSGDSKYTRRIINGDTRGFKAVDLVAYQKAQSIALEVLSESYKPLLPPSVVSFHNHSVLPAWAAKMKKYATIGQHSFYGFKRKGIE